MGDFSVFLCADYENVIQITPSRAILFSKTAFAMVRKQENM
jgi:hypothetical protein